MLYSTATNLLLNALPAALPYLYTSAASAVRATAPPAVRAPNAAARVSWHCARWAPALSSDAAIADAWGALRTLGNALALVMLLDREQGCGAMAAAGHGAALLGLQVQCEMSCVVVATQNVGVIVTYMLVAMTSAVLPVA